ncbi:3D domain-containing protein [Alicyclobacillus tolerans]|uniref:3D domain-containing protein n=1 Tax=Alicyclobacillus tolerans TaxID=90970 RepID=UPI003B817180
MRIPKSKVLYSFLGATAMLVSLGTVASAKVPGKVTVDDNGQRIVFQTEHQESVASFLREHGYQLNHHDWVQPGLSTPVQPGMVIQIETPAVVKIDNQGHWQTVWTFGQNVDEVLEMDHIHLQPGDKVSLPLSQPIVNHSEIVIQKDQQKIYTKLQEIPFQTIQRRTQKLFVGQTQVLSYGVKGLLQVKTIRNFVNNKLVSEHVERKWIRQPQSKIVLVGTSPQTYEVSSRSYSPGMFSGEITVLATAYVEGGVTSTGWLARPGVIAVDPNVIPYGTTLYIPGIGVVHAEDTGSAIVGYHIDICMANAALADAWGARTVTAYILN